MKSFLFPLLLITILSSPLLLTKENGEGAQPQKGKQDLFEQEVAKEVKKRLLAIQGENVAKLFQELLVKEKEFKKKDQVLVKREEQLQVNEQELVKKIKKFEEEQTKFIGCIKKNEETENLRVDQLVKVISNMRPVKAAEMLSVQELPISVKILGLLEPAKASKIFNLMDKEISARIQKMYLDMKK